MWLSEKNARGETGLGVLKGEFSRVCGNIAGTADGRLSLVDAIGRISLKSSIAACALTFAWNVHQVSYSEQPQPKADTVAQAYQETPIAKAAGFGALGGAGLFSLMFGAVGFSNSRKVWATGNTPS